VASADVCRDAVRGVDAILHQAALGSVPRSLDDPATTNAVNVTGTLNVLIAAKDAKARRVVYASSSSVYGPSKEFPQREDHPTRPVSPYAVSKLAAEYYVNTIGDLWNIETVSLRVFNAYGPGQHLPPAHPPVVPYFLKQALKDGSLVVHSDGSQTRDYVYVDDVVSGLVAASTAPNLDGLVINIGSGKETAVRDLVQKVLEVTDAKPEVIYNAKTSPGVSRMCADLTLAKQKLNYRPSISLANGLRLTLQRDPRLKVA
jgi:UDP-glucose 4-epimerase